MPERAWLLAIPLALLALLWSCHNALLGTAVADDYAFLANLTFQHPLDWLDSMGATFYWRPMSRQLYFSLVGPWLLQAPWLAATLHAALLALQALLLFRIARRFAPAPVAAAVAAFPLVSEQARVLLAWPSTFQDLCSPLISASQTRLAVSTTKCTEALRRISKLGREALSPACRPESLADTPPLGLDQRLGAESSERAFAFWLGARAFPHRPTALGSRRSGTC